MKKIFIASLAVVLLLPMVFAQVKISEVYYDPIGTESGGEFVELMNTGSAEVDISGWVLSTPTSAADATIPADTILSPNSYYLIADAGFMTLKDDPAWPDADYEEAITLKNTDGGLALKDSLGITIDAVGWGDPTAIGAGFYEGTPSSLANAGESLQRSQDTNNNVQDFFSSTPNLQSSNGQAHSAANASNSFLAFTVIVNVSLPEIQNITILDEDNLTSGFQVFPRPSKNKIIPISVLLSGPADTVKAVLDDFEFNLSGSGSLYSGALNLSFFESPGIKNIEIIASKSGQEVSKSASFDYESLNAFEIDVAALSCTLSPGKTCDIAGDLDMSSSDKVTLRNIGNTPIDMSVSGSDFKSKVSSFDIGSVKYSFGDSPMKLLTTNPVLNVLDLEPSDSSLMGVSFFVELPQSVKAGTYVSDIIMASIVH